MDVVSQPLAYGPGPKLKALLLDAFWSVGAYNAQDRIALCDDYFQYYHLQTRRLGLLVLSKLGNAPMTAATTHDDIIYIVEELRKRKHLQKIEVRDALKDRFLGHTEASINQCCNGFSSASMAYAQHT